MSELWLKNYFIVTCCLLFVVEPKPQLSDTKVTYSSKIKHKNDEFLHHDEDIQNHPTPIKLLRSYKQNVHFIPIKRQIQQMNRKTQKQHVPNGESMLMSRANNINNNKGTETDMQSAQNLYQPIFREAPPLGHSRPYFPPAQLPNYSDTLLDGVVHSSGFDSAMLGSGDFGIMRGGTFYPEEDMPYHIEQNRHYIAGDINTGNGRPTESFIQKYTYPEEQFANFRDFADINTPSDSAFSQFVVVYASSNSKEHKNKNSLYPKNIFEQLKSLDHEKALEPGLSKQKQQIILKSKLSKTKIKNKFQKNVDYDPLLALN